MSLFSELLSLDTVVLPHTCSNEHLPLNRFSLEFLAFLFPVLCLPNDQVKAIYLFIYFFTTPALHLGVVLWARILKKELLGRAELVVQYLCFHCCKWNQVHKFFLQQIFWLESLRTRLHCQTADCSSSHICVYFKAHLGILPSVWKELDHLHLWSCRPKRIFLKPFFLTPAKLFLWTEK